MSVGERRDPYVMLGVPFGASKETATRAFARLGKGLRRQIDGAEKLTELTWALNQVTEAIKDPRSALHIYRVPADEGALVPQGIGVLRPGPELMERTTESSTEAWQRLMTAVRLEAAQALRREVAESAALPKR